MTRPAGDSTRGHVCTATTIDRSTVGLIVLARGNLLKERVK